MDFTATWHKDTYPAIQGTCHKGLSVLVSGASRGIGRATALSFARSGASPIIIASRATASLAPVEADVLEAAQGAGQPPPAVVKLAIDVTDEPSVAKAAAEVAARLGRLDILVNNAGYLERWVPMAETDAAEWWKSWEVNVRGVHLMTRAFLPLLLRGRQKTVVNVGSMAAVMLTPGGSGYQTAKFALLKLTEHTAFEYGDQGVVAVTVHPGGVATDLALRLPDSMHWHLVDTAELAADFIAWLTAEQRAWLSGRYVSANWDVDELEARREEITGGDKLKMSLVV